MRHTRSAMLQTLGADYVRTARAKSVPERLVVLKHALRNALIPIITLGAIEFGRLLSGAVLTEQVFAIPGFGKLLVDGVFNRDYAVVQARRPRLGEPLRAAEPGRRRALLPGQPAPAGLHVSEPGAVARRARGARDATLQGGAAAGAPAGRDGRAGGGARLHRGRRVAAPQLAPYDPNAHRLPRRCARRRPPRTCSAPTRWAATCCRACIWGARASLLAGVIPVAIALGAQRAARPALGLRRRLGRRADHAHQRRHAPIPFLIVAIALAAFLGPSLGNAMIAIGIAALPTFVRLARGTVLAIKTEEYIEAARALGLLAPRIARPPHPAQHRCRRSRAGEPHGGRRHHRRGEPVVPGPGPAAARAVLGQHAQRGPALSRPRRPGWRSTPAS